MKCTIHESYETPLPGAPLTHLREIRDSWARYIAQAVADRTEPEERAVHAFRRYQTAIRHYEGV